MSKFTRKRGLPSALVLALGIISALAVLVTVAVQPGVTHAQGDPCEGPFASLFPQCMDNGPDPGTPTPGPTVMPGSTISDGLKAIIQEAPNYEAALRDYIRYSGTGSEDHVAGGADYATKPLRFEVEGLDNGARLNWGTPIKVAKLYTEGDVETIDGVIVGYQVDRDAYDMDSSNPINRTGDITIPVEAHLGSHSDLGLAYNVTYTYQSRAVVKYTTRGWWNQLNCPQMNDAVAPAAGEPQVGSDDPNANPASPYCRMYDGTNGLSAEAKKVVNRAYNKMVQERRFGEYIRFGLWTAERSVTTAESGGRLEPLLDKPTKVRMLDSDPMCANQINVTWQEPMDFGTVPATNVHGVYVGPDYIGGDIAGKEEVGEDADSVVYEIQRKVNGGPWATVVATGSMSYTDTAIAYGSTYMYRVRAMNPHGLYGSWEMVTEELTQPPTPNSPRNLRATVNDKGQVVLQWTAPEGGTPGWKADDIAAGIGDGDVSEHLSYRIERVDDDNNDTANRGNGMLFGVVSEPHQYGPRSLEGIPHEQSYPDMDPHNGRVVYVVTAFLDDCLASDGNSVSLDTATTAPGAPVDVTATADSSTEITVSWNAPASAGSRGDRVATITGYEISRIGGETVTVTGTSHTESNLTPETTYTYSVRTVNSFGEKSDAAMDSAKTDAVVVPVLGSATGLSATAGATAGTVQLSWTAGDNSTRHWLAGIKVSDWRANDFSNVIFRATSGQSSHTVSGLDSGQQYAFTVLSGNADGWDDTWTTIQYVTPN